MNASIKAKRCVRILRIVFNQKLRSKTQKREESKIGKAYPKALE